jgi:hypothetical protein
VASLFASDTAILEAIVSTVMRFLVMIVFAGIGCGDFSPTVFTVRNALAVVAMNPAGFLGGLGKFQPHAAAPIFQRW